jgi:hypothetical protein
VETSEIYRRMTVRCSNNLETVKFTKERPVFWPTPGSTVACTGVEEDTDQHIRANRRIKPSKISIEQVQKPCKKGSNLTEINYPAATRKHLILNAYKGREIK